ncbi:ABC transporter substrate-binding protein [Rhodobacter sp. TJ_12]|uniref:ABC transporter substrate-binding protein n=1 Tax=Rhodobacter sp. TJ_12 TaxID=2029399 RepID=UPI001CBAD50B|nr:extracellular solute-binding protein [Rhodobacter sp. TJ_12]MBZ4023809.1 ABC transporter substrate-binding protein [Rhodobacter sp. TJ_12]
MQRRQFLKTGAATAAAALFAPSVLRAQGAPLKVGTYGGYFQESFEKYIYPDFTAATGIAVESIAEPTGEAWLVQLSQAARAGQAPADVSMMAQVARIKGARAGLWAPMDDSALKNLGNLPEHFVHRYEDGSFYGTGAVSWYITLVTNTESYPEAPTSWTALWDPANADKLGLMSLASNSFLLEITATTYFGGTDILKTDEGVLKVMEKLAEVKPNVRLWYRDEGQFQQALETGEIPMGQYYHDVTGLAASQGKPVRSVFPDEGAVLDSGSWVVSKASKLIDQSQVFIDYMAQPEIQAKLSRFVGTAPTVARELTDLTDAEFAAVASDKTPILPLSEIYVDRGDWIAQMWSEKITG